MISSSWSFGVCTVRRIVAFHRDAAESAAASMDRLVYVVVDSDNSEDADFLDDSIDFDTVDCRDRSASAAPID
jgi:hypothetical protein